MALGNKEIMAKNIAKYMEKAGVDRNKLSADLGISYTTITDWIKGKTYPRIDKIELLANYFGVSKSDLVEDAVSDISTIYNQLDQKRQAKVYNFAEYQLREQNKRPKITIEIRGYVSAGTGEWLEDEIVDEVSYEGMIPEHDFAVKVNGDSMLPLFEDGQVIFIKGTSDVRDGQIIVCRVNNEAFVKKLSGNKLVSLNKKYEDISISDTDDFKIYGVVVL